MTREPKSSLLHFAATKLFVGAFLINFMINLAVGYAIYGRLAIVPFRGDMSVVTDTLVGAFLIGFFTYLLTAPVIHAEARVGRLPGRGRGGFFGWMKQHPVWSSFLFATLIAVVLGGTTVFYLTGQYSGGMATNTFLLFKAIFSAVVGVLASYFAAWFANQSGVAPFEDDRWCKDPDAPVDGVVYPCDYIDKGGIGITYEAEGCSGTPTWQLIVRGKLDPEHVVIALADVVTRYPSLTTIVQSLNGHPDYATHYRYATDPNFSLESMFELVDLRGKPEAELQQLLQEVFNRHTDQFRDPPMTVTMAIMEDDLVRLLFRQHHGIADGRAFLELLGDFGVYLEAARQGERPSEEALAPIGRRPELEAFGLSEKEQSSMRSAGFFWFVKGAIGRFFSPPVPLKQNDSNDYTGGNGTLHWVISEEALDPWKTARKEMGVSLNSLLTGVLFEANRRWHKAIGRDVGKTVMTMPMETRPRDGSFRSFANHLAMLEARIDLSKDDSVAEMARSIQSQVKSQIEQNMPTKRYLIEKAMVGVLPMEQVRKHVFESKMARANLDFSNLIPLEFPSIEGEGWKVDEILITTPITPRTGIVFTVIRYNGKLIFNVNYKESAATSDEAAALLGHFQSALEEATAYAPEVLPTEAVLPEPLPAKEREVSTGKSVFDFSWRGRLLRPGLGWKLGLLAALLALPSIFNGIVLDDQLQHLYVDGAKSPHYSMKNPMDLFHFISTDNHKALTESGAYPWWAAPKLQLAFFRPISSLTHWVEYKFWPQWTKLMHLHNLFWLALMVLMATMLYRRFFQSAWVAALAALLYGLDEARGLAIGFLANRNALMTTIVAILVLIVHDKWRKDEWKPGAFLGPLLLAVGMFTAEFTIFATAYLFAYSLFLEKKTSWKRWLPLVPYATVVVLWRMLYNHLGYGAIQSGAYIDPVGDPIRFFLATLERLPTLLLAQWTPISSDFWMTNTNTYNAYHALFGAIVLAIIAWIMVPVLRKIPLARFWFVGMLLSALPICATFPHDRLLLGVGLGAMGLIAQFMAFRYGEPVEGETQPKPSSSFSLPVRFLCGFLLISHVYLAPVFLPLKSISPFFLGRLEARSFKTMPKHPEITRKNVYLVHSPGFLAHTIIAMNALNNRPQPNVLRQLAITLDGMTIKRVDNHTLVLSSSGALVDRSTRYLTRSTSLPFHVGQVFKTPDVTVTVKKLGLDGHPSQVEFRFHRSLEHSSYLWMIWKGSGFVPFKLPAVGKSIKSEKPSPTAIFL